MRMLISGFSPAKELGTRANQKISGYNRIRVDGWKRFEYAACGRENFRIRKKKICGKKNFRIRADMALVRRLAKLDVGDPVVELNWTKVDPNSNLIRLIKTSTSTPGPHLNCKNQPSDFLVSEPMTINIQNRQHIRPFSPFNSVRAAFLKSCLCFLCPHGACVCCYPNLHFFFQSLRPFRDFFRVHS